MYLFVYDLLSEKYLLYYIVYVSVDSMLWSGGRTQDIMPLGQKLDLMIVYILSTFLVQ